MAFLVFIGFLIFALDSSPPGGKTGNQQSLSANVVVVLFFIIFNRSLSLLDFFIGMRKMALFIFVFRRFLIFALDSLTPGGKTVNK